MTCWVPVPNSCDYDLLVVSDFWNPSLVSALQIIYKKIVLKPRCLQNRYKTREQLRWVIFFLCVPSWFLLEAICFFHYSVNHGGIYMVIVWSFTFQLLSVFLSHSALLCFFHLGFSGLPCFRFCLCISVSFLHVVSEDLPF